MVGVSNSGGLYDTVLRSIAMPSKIERESNLYIAKLDKTMSDGKVTPREADALIKDAKNGRFTQLEAHYLSAFIDRSKRKFDPADILNRGRFVYLT